MNLAPKPRRSGWRATDPGSEPGWLRLEQPMMGTEVSVELWHEDRAHARACAQAVIGEYQRIDALMSTYRPDSEISRLNREAGTQASEIGVELFELVARSLELARLSDGAFDITYDGIGQLYDLRAGVTPTRDAIREHLALIDWRAVELDPARRRVRFRRPGMRLNLGGIGKGYAVERGATILRERGVRHALLNAGGDSRAVGDRRGQPWMVGIRDPRREGESIARLPLVDEAISTAGDYERCFLRADGERVHHILDPATGLPSRGMRSVTVIGPDATLTDGLDTALFVMGVHKGMALIAAMPGYEAIAVDGDGRLFYSGGLTGGLAGGVAGGPGPAAEGA